MPLFNETHLPLKASLCLTCKSGDDRASSEKFLLSTFFSCSPTEGKRKLNFRLFGETGVVGAGVVIDLVLISFARAIAVSSVFSSWAEIGFTVACFFGFDNL